MMDWFGTNASAIQAFAGAAQAFFALILICVGFAQLCVYRKQAQLMDAARKIASDQAEIAKGQSTILAGQLAETRNAAQAAIDAATAAKLQAHTAERQAVIAERTLTGLERPYILIDKITVATPPHPLKGIITKAGEPIPLRVDFSLRNFGRSPAIVHEVIFKAIASDEFPTDPDYRRPNMIPYDTVVGPNSGIPGLMTNMLLDVPFFAGRVQEPSKVFFFGYVRYIDAFGIMYFRRAAYRIVSPERFLTVPGTKYNGEDRYESWAPTISY